MKIFKKLQEARDIIKNSDIKKQGWNSFSEYDYFTPEQIQMLVFEACKQVGILELFDLTQSERGYFGTLTLINISKPSETIIFMQATAIPTITATNAAQQVGGAVTYTKRYMLMNAFNIIDNNLDPDASKKDNSDKKKTPKYGKKEDENNGKETELMESDIKKWGGKIYGNSIYIDKKKIVVSAKQLAKLKKHPKFKAEK